MGTDFFSFIRNRISKEVKLAFVGTFFIALLIHLYHFTNTLPNHDSILQYYADQNMIGSGRWALSLACGLSSYFDLPWVIGLFSCFFIGLTCALITALLQLRNPVLILLSGGLLASSPAITETFFFLFTADGYMIAMFLGALGVYFSRIEEHRPLFWILSSLCICISCGIYQAYVSFALVLAVCYLMHELFLNRWEKKRFYSWILRQICIFAGALVVYYLIWQLSMKISGISASNYQGIDKVGTISVQLLTGGAVRAVKSVLKYFLQWNIFKFGLTPYIFLNLLFALAFMIGLISAVKHSHILSRPWAFFLLILCLIAIIPFACMWHFTSDSVNYRAMMLQSLILLFLFTGLNFETWTGSPSKNAAALLLCAVIVNNGLMANIGYFYLHYSYERTYAEGLEMSARYHSLQTGREINRIAVLGSRHSDVKHYGIDPETGLPTPISSIQIISEDLLEESMLFDSFHIPEFLKMTFGMDLEYVPRTEREQIFNLPEVQAMNCWPLDNSMAVIDDILVIKLSDSWDW